MHFVCSSATAEYTQSGMPIHHPSLAITVLLLPVFHLHPVVLRFERGQTVLNTDYIPTEFSSVYLSVSKHQFERIHALDKHGQPQ